MIVRFYRRPKKQSPILELVTCEGCVTPKLCKRSGKCDVDDEVQKKRTDMEKEKTEVIEKIHPPIKKPNRLSQTKSQKSGKKVS